MSRRLTKSAQPSSTVRLGLATAAMLLPVAAPAEEPLQPFAAQYEGSKRLGPLTAKGVATIRLLRGARHWIYTIDTRVRWGFIERLFHECSVVAVAAGRLQPLEYLHLDRGDAASNLHTRFDWATGLATTRFGNADAADARTVSAPLVWPTWDPMSFQVALMSLAAGGPTADSQPHRVIERGVLRQHEVRFAGATAADGPDGALFEVVSRKGDDDIVLQLLSQRGWQPQRISVDGVSFERVRSVAAASAPADDVVPQCGGASP